MKNIFDKFIKSGEYTNAEKEDTINTVKLYNNVILFIYKNINKFCSDSIEQIIKDKKDKYKLLLNLLPTLKINKNTKLDNNLIKKIEIKLLEIRSIEDKTRLKRQIGVFNEDFEKYGLKTKMGDLDISLFNKNILSIKELQNFLVLKMGMFSLGELLKTDKIGKYGKRTNVLLYNYLRHKGILKEGKIFKQKNISNKILELIKDDIKNAKKGNVETVNNIEKDNNLPDLGEILENTPTSQTEVNSITKPKEKINDSYENFLNEIIDDEKYKKINKESLKNSLLNLSKTKLSNLVQELKNTNYKIKKENIFNYLKFNSKSDNIEFDRNFLNKDYSFFVPIIKEFLNGYEQKGNFGPIETSEIIEILLKINFVIS